MKKYLSVIPLVLLICFVVGCQDKAAMAELEEFKAQAVLEGKNRELIHNFYEQWHCRDIDALSTMHAPSAKYNHPSIGSEPISFEEALEGMKMLWQAFPDLTLTIEDLVTKGDKVVVRFIGQGTHQGDLAGIPATGNRTIASGIEIYHVEDGKIVDVWEISDRLGLMQQLGFELKPKEQEK